MSSKFSKNFIFLCDDAVMGENGKISLIGIFEKVNFVSIPSSLLKCVLVGNFNILDKAEEDVAIQINLLDEQGNIVGLKAPEIKLRIKKNEKKERKLGFIVEIGNLKFEKTGKYKFEIKANSERIAIHEFEVATVQKST